MTLATATRSAAPADVSAGRRPGTMTVLRWELTKLAAQARSRALLAVAVLVPVVVVLILNSQQQPPTDTIYGRHIHTSGYAMPLLMLAFAAQWVLPLLAAVVAGDIFATRTSTAPGKRS
jgi:ABC-2 type transport system permease protein